MKEIADSIGLYAGVALGAAMRRVKSNHTYLDTAFAAEQAKSQLLKTGLAIICAFDSDLSLAPIGHYCLPKTGSARGDPTLMELIQSFEVDTTAYSAVLVGPKTGSSAIGALQEALDILLDWS